MPAPPKHISPGELYRRLQERPKPSRVVDMPASDDAGALGSVRVSVLRLDEIDDARFSAEEWLRKKLRIPNGTQFSAGPATGEILADRIACEIIARAVTTAEPIPGSEDTEVGPIYGRLFDGADDVRRKLAADELMVLFTQYQVLQAELGPTEASLSEEDVDRWVATLAEGASTLPLARLSFLQLANLTLMLAQRVSSGFDPPTSPSEDSPSTSESEDATSHSGTSSSGAVPAERSRQSEPVIMSAAEVAEFAAQMHRS